MRKQSDKREWLIISESDTPNPHQETTQARRQLYNLIVRFRKEAENTADPKIRTKFEIAAEIMAALAYTFRQHENRPDGDPSGETKPPDSH